MHLTIVMLGPESYQIEQPEPSWHQPSVNLAAECVVCQQTLSFTFDGRTELAPESSTQATPYLIPSGIRCDCFLESSQPEKLPYHRKLRRAPVRIVPLRLPPNS